jgi:hypothetical protein
MFFEVELVIGEAAVEAVGILKEDDVVVVLGK